MGGDGVFFVLNNMNGCIGYWLGVDDLSTRR